MAAASVTTSADTKDKKDGKDCDDGGISGLGPAKPKVQINEVAEKFVNNYYAIFSKNRAELASLYHETSCLSFEGQGYQGTQKIMNKLKSLPIKSIKHEQKTVDVQVKQKKSLIS